MGCFSWITQDTKRSISIINPFTVHMLDDKGNIYTEHDYCGYGLFQGKDFYQLLAEMNNAEGLNGDVDNDRSIGIHMFFGISGIRNTITGQIYLASGVDFVNWKQDILPHGLSANESLLIPDWIDYNKEFKNLKYPNFYENKELKWKNKKPKECPNQGFFE